MNERSFFFSSAAFTMLVTFLYYLPWAFEPLQVIGTSDTLDGEVVVNHIIGQLYRGDPNASFLALNGQIPSSALPRFLQPLSLLYLLESSWLSYVLIDIFVRSIAFAGIYLLASSYRLPKHTCVLLALCFSTSISFSVFLLSVAGIPLIIYLLMLLKKVDGIKQAFVLLGLLMIGSNMSFALSGLFAALMMPLILVCGFKEPITRKLIFGYLLLCLGIVLGNINLFYVQFFSDITWHRAEWGIFREINYSLWRDLLMTIKASLFGNPGNPFYHVTYSLPFAVCTLIGFFLLSKDYRKSNLRFLIGLLAFFILIYTFSTSSLSYPLRETVPFLNSFQWDRFYFLYSTIVFVSIIFLFKAAEFNRRHSAILVVLVSLQLGYNLIQTPHIKEVVKLLIDRDAGTSFYEYYKTNDYKSIQQLVGNDAVMSVGIDPMIAPMNGIRAIDGYYVLYPLSYKKEFRAVIAKSMLSTTNADYFDKWGNRVYAFYPKGNPNLLDFCAAHRLGARYVISNEQISNEVVGEVKTFNSKGNILLYKILNARCVS